MVIKLLTKFGVSPRGMKLSFTLAVRADSLHLFLLIEAFMTESGNPICHFCGYII